MASLPGFLKIFASIGRWAMRAFGVAKIAGLSDEVVERALELVKRAATMFVDNAEKREWVVRALVAAGVKESIARLAVELAVQLFKARARPL